MDSARGDELADLEHLAARLQVTLQDLSEAQRIAKVGVWRWTVGTQAFAWSDELYRMTGRDPSTFSVTLDSTVACLYPDDRRTTLWTLIDAVRTKANRDCDFRLARVDGEVRHCRAEIQPILDADGKVVTVRGICQDISDLKSIERALRESEEHYRYTVELNPQMPFTADAAGNVLEIGPRWLQLVGLSREQALGQGWVVAIHPDDIGPTLDRLSVSYATGRPIDLRCRLRLRDGSYSWVRSRASARRGEDGRILRWYGIVEDIHEQVEAEQQLRGAAARRGPTMSEAARRVGPDQRTLMIASAREALSDDRIVPFYQPQVELATDRIAGFEALLRWHHPTNGLLGPRELAAAFEDIETASAISDRQIGQVIGDMRRWLDSGIDFGHVAVNASEAEFSHDDFAERVLDRLRQAGVPPRCLQLEVTETVFLGRGREWVGRALELLAAEGVTISLDDFGTGYASLKHLKEFPVGTIKIDKGFVKDMEVEASDDAIVRTVIDLGRNLSIKVVAEGVETRSQANHLRRLGCDYGQGYLYSRAVSADRVPNLIASSKRLANAEAGAVTRVPSSKDGHPPQMCQPAIGLGTQALAANGRVA